MSKSFFDNEIVKIVETDSDLDGMMVHVVGIAFDCRPANGSIYVVMPVDKTKKFENGWSALCMSESCLMKVKQPVVKKAITNDQKSGITASVLVSMSNASMNYIRKQTSTDLTALNSTLGRNIRNDFGLWDFPWEPNIDLATGVDYSPNHPEAVSMDIIRSIWNILQKGKDV